MLKGLGKTWLLITFLFIVITGALSTMYLIRDYNIQSDIFGTPTENVSAIKIDDFNFEIKYLMFNNTGNENEYLATATTLPITDFDITKKYTLKVNNSLCNRTPGQYDYIQATFNNKFKDYHNNVLFDGSMEITILPYADYTKLNFIISGENSSNYWNQYITNYGLKIYIEEFDFESKLEADEIPEFNVYYYDTEGNLIEKYTQKYLATANNFTLKAPYDLNGTLHDGWLDSNGSIITVDNLNYVINNRLDYHFHLYDYVEEMATVLYIVNNETYKTYQCPINEEITLLNYETENEYFKFFGWFDEEPHGDLTLLPKVTTLTPTESKVYKIYGFDIAPDAGGKIYEGYNDAEFSVEINFSNNLDKDKVYGVLVIECEDLLFGITRRYSLGLKNTTYNFKGLIYGTYKILIQGLSSVNVESSVESLTFNYENTRNENSPIVVINVIKK